MCESRVMTVLAGYELEMLRPGGEFDLYRGRHCASAAPVLLLAAGATAHPSASLRRLEHEYSLAGDLDPAWALRPLAIARQDERVMLVLTDPGGVPLDSLLGRPLELTRALQIAIDLAAALRQVHERGLIHKDIKPANIFIDAAGAVRLTGFGIASRLLRERQMPGAPELIAGTLAYMAPEQTGRMNRSIDARSDLYSLGVTLYEMLTGSLPFSATDTLEWIHCHIARPPAPPGTRAVELPPMLDTLVLKLLAKNAEDRYQTAAGVEMDLRRCLAEWTRIGRIDPFPLGEHDVPDRLLMPEKLYGRDAQIRDLLAAFDRVVTGGNAELVLLSGYAGIGKSSVVNELHKSLVPPRGLFASGKFDQYKRNIPYATLAQAFQSLVRQLLGKDAEELHSWRNALLEALGGNGQLMVTLVPELALVIGEPPPVPTLEPKDAQARFHLVFRRLLGVFARPEHPLALFLDDLQWLDAATLELLGTLLVDPETRHLLLIGAYRDNEVTPDHPLMQTVEAIRRRGGRLSGIELAPLSEDDLAQLIADGLHAGIEQARPLSGLVHEKTGGNPFFAIQFVTMLVDEGLLVFDRQSLEWRWDMKRIHAKGITDNLADLMALKLSRLSDTTKLALGQLACLGNIAEVATIASAHGRPEHEVHETLRDAVQAGLLFRADGTYTFVHDRVQEAAYALIPETERAAAHLRLGRVLACATEPESREEKIFEIVNQLNRGAALIDSPQERAQVAELDLAAGKRARASTAFASALAYFSAGQALLAGTGVDPEHRLAFELELQRAECEFVTGEVDAAEARLLVLRENATDLPRLADVVCLAVLLYFTTGRSDRAAEIGLEFLRRVGINWSMHPTDEEVRREHESLHQRLADRAIESLVALPRMTDARHVATMNVLTSFFPVAFYVDENALALVLLRMTNLSLEHGNTDASSVAYSGLNMVLGPRFGEYVMAYSFGKLARHLVDQRSLDQIKVRVYSCVGSFAMGWTQPLSACRPLMKFAVDAGSTIGDLAFAAYTYRHMITNLLISGDPLADVQREAERALAFAARARLGVPAERFIGHLPLIRTLRGLSGAGVLAPEDTPSDSWVDRSAEMNPYLASLRCFHWIFRLQERYLAEDHAAAIDAADHARGLAWSTHSCLEEVEYHLYGALVRAAACDRAQGDERRAQMEILQAHHRQVALWAQNCPANFAHRAALISAEIARLEGRDLEAMRLYDSAIASAREHGFTQNEGLANELAARFYAARDFQTIAGTYRRGARACYLRWGAMAKVRQLEQRYPDLQEPAAQPGPTATIGASGGDLDAGTMLKASQALSSEIVLRKLIESLMRITIEHAGAERGIVLLVRKGEPQIVAEATMRNGTIDVVRREAAVTAADLPESALHAVLRTRQSLILDDAMDGTLVCDDPYMQLCRPKSILLVPILKQAKLIGALYLENNLASGAFTPARIEVLEFLASQAAISLENAFLYADLQRSEAFLAEAQRMSSTGSWSWNVITGDLVWSEEHCRIFGLDPANPPPLTYDLFISLVHPEDRPMLEQKLPDVVRDRARAEFDYRIVLRDGSIKHLHSVGRPIVDEHGEVRDYVGSSMDVTDRRRAEAALREAEAELTRVARLTTMGELAASIAHEVNQPLSAIVTNAEACLRWISRDAPDLDRVRKAAERIIQTGHQAGEVIRNIRAMLRKSTPELCQVDLNEVILSVLDLMHGELKGNTISLEIDLSSELVRILGDRVQLQQVVVNLIKNGIEAMSDSAHEPRLLRVATRRAADGSALTAVADSGTGLEPTIVKRIFEPFFTTKRDGMGLGLSICHSIVEAHGGRLWVSQGIPRGCVFQFTLPAVPEQQARASSR